MSLFGGLGLLGWYEQELQQEYEWLRKQENSKIYDMFLTEIDLLSQEIQRTENTVVNKSNSMKCKMIYAYSITLLESFLGDNIKLLISNNEDIFNNAISNIDELKNKKYTLKAVGKKSIKELAIDELSDILFHNIPKVIKIYQSSLNIKSLDCQFDKIAKMVKIRHDIVHRNGKDTKGVDVKLYKDQVTEAIREIKEFATCIQKQIEKSVTGY